MLTRSGLRETARRSTELTWCAVRRKKNHENHRLHFLALALGVAFAMPTFAGDVLKTKTKVDCEKAGDVGCEDQLVPSRRVAGSERSFASSDPAQQAGADERRSGGSH